MLTVIRMIDVTESSAGQNAIDQAQGEFGAAFPDLYNCLDMNSQRSVRE
jgi:hypothetical protein